jgi:hypothetical protein
MSWTKVHVIAVVALLAVAAVGQAGLKVIYYDDFSGAASEPLNGAMPDISANRTTWVAGQYAHADGSYGDGVTAHMWTATLPWTPVAGTMYELEAKVDNQGDWYGIGFIANNVTINYETRLLDNQPRLWCLVRQTGAASTNFDQAFVGPGTQNGLGNATVRSASKLRIRLNTIKTPWVATWYYDDVQAFQRTVDPSTFTIGYIAMGANGLFSAATGKISLFRLVEVTTLGEATNPSPANEATEVYRDTNLSWTPGEFAATHDVYLGTNFDDVNSASRDKPGTVLVSKGQDANAFDPGRLDFGKTYYWRIDEVNAPPSTAIFKSSVWSFTVEQLAYKIDANDITATASSSGAGAGPENVINGSGLDANDRHSTSPATMWLTAPNAVGPAWIQFQFDKVYSLYQMWVWNHNTDFEESLGFGLKGVTIRYSVNGTSWMDLKSVELAQAPGVDGYAHNTTVDFGSVAAKYVRIDVTSNWGGVQYGLSEVRFLYIPVQARSPRPASGSPSVAVNTALSWMPGREAASHQVYISTDEKAVTAGTVSAAAVTIPSFAPSLNVGQTYYWKVNEVNQAAAVKTWDGDVWSFTTSPYIIIDDMESYNDSSRPVFNFWVDGYGTSVNGAQVGYDAPANGTFGEISIVHGGGQSMPLAYGRDGITNSEATRTFEPAQDWTVSGVSTLALYFYGRATNTTTVPLWVKLTDQAGKSAKVTFGSAAGEDPLVLADPAWTEWNIPLSSFTGVGLTKIKSMTIGVGSGLGSGLLLIDDIRLRAVVTSTPVTPTLAGWWKLDNDVKDSSGNGNNGTITGSPTYAAGKIGSALTLNGTADYVDCGAAASLDILKAVTLSVWIKPANFANSAYQTFVSKGDHAYCLHHTNGNVIEFYIYNTGWRSINGGPVTSTYNATWHHVAGTYDGSQLKLYVDGKMAGSTLWTGTIDTATHSVSIGRNSEQSGRLFNGAIDDVRIYRGALPTSEIVKLANP